MQSVLSTGRSSTELGPSGLKQRPNRRNGAMEGFSRKIFARAQRLSDAFLYVESGPLLQLSIPVGRNTPNILFTNTKFNI